MNTTIILFRQRQSFKHPKFTREQIRNVARQLGIKRGQNTLDTLRNLKAAGVVL